MLVARPAGVKTEKTLTAGGDLVVRRSSAPRLSGYGAV